MPNPRSIQRTSAQILGGVLAARIRGLVRHPASALIAMAGGSAITIGAIGLAESFWAVIGLTVVWGLLFSATMPIRQAFLNDMIPSQQRATILSFDSLMSSAGGAWGQPVLGRAADPFLALSRRRAVRGEGLGTSAAPTPQPA